ncbi:glucose-6-phosphate isomerase [bacterium]|nr:glucose-6-phosphate isomerase [bacterium]
MQKVCGIELSTDLAESFLEGGAVQALAPEIARVADELEARQGPGHEFLGWLDLPTATTDETFERYDAAAARARDDSEAVVVVGIGGSYLGARAVLDALGPGPGAPWILYAGTGLCATQLRGVLSTLEDRDFRVCVISKSGTTLEPALSFRILRGLLEERYGADGAARRITAITDAEQGALRAQADAAGWESHVIPGDVGGRFSVLTPVGLWPLAVAGVDVRALVGGAATMRAACRDTALHENPAHLYAAVRAALYRAGFMTEVQATFHTGLATLGEWWKQLFGESEGKDGKGIFPTSTLYTTDLHSLGQYLQDGRRDLLESFLVVREDGPPVTVPADVGDGGDGLDYLVGRRLDDINWQAFAGTRQAHVDGGVPCLTFALDRLDAAAVGGLIYLFEKAVAVSGRLLGVNPFDQPGVEAYKREMFRRLGKPGS